MEIVMSFRKEKKFRMSYSDLALAKTKLLEMGMTKLHPNRVITSQYFDTRCLKMFSESEEGLLPRKKIREVLGIGPDNVLIGYMGSLMPDKGIEMMVESFSELYKQNPETKIRFVIIGGPAKFLSELKDLGTKLGGDKIITCLLYTSDAADD